MKKWVLWLLTVLSFLVFVFGVFHIPILGACGVKFPERNFLWVISIIPTVVLSAIPFCVCLIFLIKNFINSKKGKIKPNKKET